MLRDVLASLGRVPVLEGVLVVTRDRVAIDLARQYGCDRLLEQGNDGHSQAVSRAAAVLCKEGVQSLLAIPADVPLATPGEIGQVVMRHEDPPSLTLVPDRLGVGSNCVACSPPEVIRFCFGVDSFRRHLDGALRDSVRTRVVRLPGLGLDIDRPADLRRLLQVPASTHTHAYLADSGIAQRLGGHVGGRDPVRVSVGEIR